MADTQKKILVTNDYENYRIDRFLIKFLSLPKSLIHKELRKNRIKVNKKKTKFDYRLAIGDEVILFKDYTVNQSKKKNRFHLKMILMDHKSYEINHH